MYQDFLAQGELQRKESVKKCEKKAQQIEYMKMTENGKKDTMVEKVKTFPQSDDVFLPHLTSNSIKMLNSDLSPVSDSFNPTCQICHTKLCTSGFNPQLQNSFSTCVLNGK